MEKMGTLSKIRPTWAEVNLDQLMENVRNIRKHAKGKRVIAIIKADAYGHGAPEIARYMVEAGADEIGVAVITEALQLRKAGVTVPIMVLSYTPLDYAEEAIMNDISISCYHGDFVEELDRIAASLGKKALVNIKVDTGMGRLGFLPNDESMEEVVKMGSLQNIHLRSLFAHFASADSADKAYSEGQLRAYRAFRSGLDARGVAFEHYHHDNSAGIIEFGDEDFDSVRPGIILYGYYPSDEVQKGNVEVKPAMSLKSYIVQLKTVPKGTSISYGNTYYTEKESTKVATLPVGYADGYSRRLSSKGIVLIGGKKCPVLGRVCMDHIMVDVTECPDVREGDEAILMGSDGLNSMWADQIAEMTGTISYVVISAVSKRVPRVYFKDGVEMFRKNHI
ncbi:MAG TPA: alanine racemase [Clostridiaceae bacterium]|nr:alanine racemase [Clostridiaceae bacterium]